MPVRGFARQVDLWERPFERYAVNAAPALAVAEDDSVDSEAQASERAASAQVLSGH